MTNTSFEGLTSLVTLHLEDNHLESLAGQEFTTLTSLTHLFLQNNFITAIGEATFRPLTRLTTLRLDGNLLTSWPAWQLAASNPGLVSLQLARNMWTCECDFVLPFLDYQVTFLYKKLFIFEFFSMVSPVMLSHISCYWIYFYISFVFSGPAWLSAG